tara:strand:- start:2773 stop:3630 length:858 start_codon:yes stop_codon:yes gene_type:complete
VEQKLEIREYRKQNKKGFFTVLLEGFSNIKSSNYLAYQLAKRDISAQYRQSILGLLWSVILPLSTALLWIFLKGSNTVSLEETNINYTLYVFIGTMAWAIITESIMGPINSTLTMRSTLSKINFPKEALITSSAYKTLFNTGVKLIILILLLFFYKEQIGFNLLLFPFTLFVILLFGTALGTLITPIGLLYGDVSKLMAPALQMLMYVSPVVFAMPQNKEGVFNTLIHINPLSPLVNNFRNTLLSQVLEDLPYYFLILGISFILFCVSLVIFKITIPIITERISS